MQYLHIMIVFYSKMKTLHYLLIKVAILVKKEAHRSSLTVDLFQATSVQ